MCSIQWYTCGPAALAVIEVVKSLRVPPGRAPPTPPRVTCLEAVWAGFRASSSPQSPAPSSPLDEKAPRRPTTPARGRGLGRAPTSSPLPPPARQPIRALLPHADRKTTVFPSNLYKDKGGGASDQRTHQSDNSVCNQPVSVVLFNDISEDGCSHQREFFLCSCCFYFNYKHAKYKFQILKSSSK